VLSVLTNVTCTPSNTTLTRKQILFIFTLISKQILFVLTSVTCLNLLSYYDANLLKYKNIKLYKYKMLCVNFVEKGI